MKYLACCFLELSRWSRIVPSSVYCSIIFYQLCSFNIAFGRQYLPNEIYICSSLWQICAFNFNFLLKLYQEKLLSIPRKHWLYLFSWIFHSYFFVSSFSPTCSPLKLISNKAVWLSWLLGSQNHDGRRSQGGNRGESLMIEENHFSFSLKASLLHIQMASSLTW